MTDPKMSSVTLHIDEEIGSVRREDIRNSVLKIDGVMAAVIKEKTPHLIVAEYDADKIKTQDILHRVTAQGVHAELLG